MTPRRIRTGNQQTIGGLDVVIAHRYRVLAKRLFLRHHGRAHAQARIGINIIATDKAFHQLIDDVILFGQQLPRDIKTHTVRTELID